MVEKTKIIWDKQVSYHLKDIYDYISEDSIQSAKTVKEKILSTIRKLPDNPYIFEKDRLKKIIRGFTGHLQYIVIG